jgi:hypothetical protein
MMAGALILPSGKSYAMREHDAFHVGERSRRPERGRSFTTISLWEEGSRCEGSRCCPGQTQYCHPRRQLTEADV